MLINRRELFGLAVGAAASMRSVAATSALPGSKPGEQLLYVNDGDGSSREVAEVSAAFRPLGAFIAATSRGAVGVRAGARGEPFAAVVKTEKPAFMFVKGIDHAGLAIRDDGYSVVARVDSPFVACFIASKACTAKKLEDLAGFEILLPAAGTFAAKMAVATLRSKGIKTKEGVDPTGRNLPVESGVITLRHTRSDEAVFTGVGGGMYPDWRVDGSAFQQVGVVSPEMAAQWKAKGGRIFQEMRPMPNWCLLAASTVPEQTRRLLQRSLLSLGEAERQAILSPIGVKRMAEGTDKEYLDALAFVAGA